MTEDLLNEIKNGEAVKFYNLYLAFGSQTISFNLNHEDVDYNKTIKICGTINYLGSII